MKYGRNSRVDILLSGAGRPDAYVEVKNVHLMRNAGLAEFPDSVTARGAKHLAELADMVGGRAPGGDGLPRPADRLRPHLSLAGDIDPAYAAAFAAAAAPRRRGAGDRLLDHARGDRGRPAVALAHRDGSDMRGRRPDGQRMRSAADSII